MSDKPEKITKEWVRENLPQSVAFADAFREVFGDGVEMTYASENGYELGVKGKGEPIARR